MPPRDMCLQNFRSRYSTHAGWHRRWRDWSLKKNAENDDRRVLQQLRSIVIRHHSGNNIGPIRFSMINDVTKSAIEAISAGLHQLVSKRGGDFNDGYTLVQRHPKAGRKSTPKQMIQSKQTGDKHHKCAPGAGPRQPEPSPSMTKTAAPHKWN